MQERDSPVTAKNIEFDRQGGTTSLPVRVGVFLMQKDEHDLFPVFVKYYGEAFGYDHIHVFDNGSLPSMQTALDHAKSLGVHVNTDHNTPQDFERKGAILGDAINANQENYDVFLPLDCDEFIGLKEAGGNYTCDATALLNFFGSLEPGAYRTTERVRNNLTDLDRFFVYGGNPKVFIVKTPVIGLDVGLHRCKGPKDMVDSALCHFEMHNKPFAVLQQHARNKMELRVDVNDADALERYTGKGIHLIRFLRKNAEKAYATNLQNAKWFETQALKKAFAAIELKHPFVGHNNDTTELENGIGNVSSSHRIDESRSEQPLLNISSEISDLLKSTYANSNGIFEYGSGDSTLIAGRSGKPFVSIETDRERMKAINTKLDAIDERHRHSNVFWVDIGKTKEWGFPVDNTKFGDYWKYPLSAWMEDIDFSPDTVLISGRMRKACFCTALAMSKKPIRILFEGYTKRQFYHEVEFLVKPTKLVGRMAVFDVTPGLVSINDLPKFLPWFSQVW